MAKTGKEKKIIAGLVVGVLATTAIVCVAVPQVRNKLGDLINEIKNKFKSEEEKNNDRKEQAQDDDRYKDLDEENKKKFEEKFNQIIGSEEYKEKTDKEKDEIIDKLVESEKIQQEVQKEQVEQETRKEEVKQELENLTSNKQELEQRVQDLKDSGASEDEIKAAEQEQQKVEEQIKEAEQEQKYYETVDTVKDATSNIQIFQDKNPGTSIRKIYGIYKWSGTAYINADIVQTETIGGVDIFSTTNGFCEIDIQLEGDYSYQKILEEISNSEFAKIDRVCTNKNAESHKEFFEQNKFGSLGFQLYDDNGYNISVLESWESDKSEYPEFIIQAKNAETNDIRIVIVQYNSSTGRYSRQQIEKICPEFWAQVEAEQNKQSEQAQASVEQFATRNEAGEMKGFDYTAFRQAEETKAEKQTTAETKQSNVLYDDLDFSL